jgi:hypothetical protein
MAELRGFDVVVGWQDIQITRKPMWQAVAFDVG